MQKSLYHGHRFSATEGHQPRGALIFQGSARLRDIEELLIERGVIVSYEASHAGAAS
jgi:hypothetical protein